MRILEVGAGTGAMTRQLMKPLTSTLGDDDAGKNSRYRQYDYTDVSSFFLGPAQEVYADQGSRMQFRKLNIEMDPEAQGFDCGTYDIVVAAAVSQPLCFIPFFLTIYQFEMSWQRLN